MCSSEASQLVVSLNFLLFHLFDCNFLVMSLEIFTCLTYFTYFSDGHICIIKTVVYYREQCGC